ncbi:MAG: hypothetical protein ACREFB_01930, partial [Stellaceae bacterium]
MNDSEPPSTDGALTGNGQGASFGLRNLLRLLRRQRAHAKPIDAMVAAAEAEGGVPIAPQERVLISNILKVHDRTAADVMVPRGD